MTTNARTVAGVVAELAAGRDKGDAPATAHDSPHAPPASVAQVMADRAAARARRNERSQPATGA
jgi:hypothetical protein